MKIEDNGYSEERTLLKEQKEIALERTKGSCLNISEDCHWEEIARETVR